VVDVHATLRDMIISGELPPGAPLLLQAEMTRRLNVSRTPMREAFRLLQEEGLIENQPDQRAFVREIDPGELDSVYTSRIMLEAVAVSITVRLATADHVKRMNSALQQMRAYQADEDIDRWQEAHRQFHGITTEGAGPNLQNSITSLRETSERLMRLAQLGHLASWAWWDADHQALVEAFKARDHDACQDHRPAPGADRLHRDGGRRATPGRDDNACGSQAAPLSVPAEKHRRRRCRARRHARLGWGLSRCL
jgi:DNA-binding GntR family transcriptional regulator